jgi:hypothetical protein
MSKNSTIVVRDYALSELITEGSTKKTVVVRGIIDPASLGNLQSATYQREILPESKVSELLEAVRTGSAPDIELGMRGFNETATEDGQSLKLLDPVFIIDGLQRVTAALTLMQTTKHLPHLGACIHLGSTEEWERKHFQILNSRRVKLSPNVLMRNLQDEMKVVKALMHLTTKDDSFVLCNRVAWNQRMERRELLTAMVLSKAIGMLHSHIGAGRASSYMDVSRGLDGIMKKVGEKTFIANTKFFFSLIDDAWGIRKVAYKESASWLKGTFLMSLASVLSTHVEFWKDHELVIDSSLRKKLTQFPVQDPTVSRLSSSGGRSREVLEDMLVRHLNSGRRTTRLVPRE